MEGVPGEGFPLVPPIGEELKISNNSSESLPKNNLNYVSNTTNGAVGNVTFGEAETLLIETDTFKDDQAFLGTLLGMFWVMFMVSCSCRRRTPGREHWRGAQIRQRYLQMREEERAKEARESLTPRDRRRLVNYNIRTKRVVAKDEDGNMTLGSVNTANDDSTTRSSPMGPQGDQNNIEDEDDEHVCVVCLDSFQVGDVVSWSRFSEECHHVYHAECVQPWFEGKRMDDCPCCRCKVILEEPPPRKAESVITDGTVIGSINMESEESEDEEDGDLFDQVDDDNFFVIVRGMISRATRPLSRAAKRASYTLIGSKDSMDSGDNSNILTPTPLRRVKSHDSSLGGRARLSSVSSAASNPELLKTSSEDKEPQSPLGRSFECSGDIEEGNMTPLADPSPFRKVQSDIGCPSPARVLRFDLPDAAQLDLSNYLEQVKQPSNLPDLAKEPSADEEEENRMNDEDLA